MLKAKNTNDFRLFFGLFFIFCSILCFLPCFSAASDEPFTGPANWGGTGLMETPTARVLKQDRYRAGASQIEPYRYYYIVFSPIKNFEMGGRLTEVMGVKTELGDAYGNLKDKAFDVKYKFIEEGKYSPAVSLGIMDPHGTRLYTSQYLVASKQIYPFDFTLGLGNGRFGKNVLPGQGEGFKIEMFNNPQGWLQDSQFFWGIQFAPSEKFALMMEYSPIRYEEQKRDPAWSKYFQEPVPSNFNYGMRLKPWNWTDIDLSYQRGNTFGLNLSVAFDLGQPLLPIYDHPYKEKQEDAAYPLNKRLVQALSESGFGNIGIDLRGNDLWIEAQNNKYFYVTKAIGVILKIVNDIAPLNIENVHIVITDNQIPRVRFTTTRFDIMEFYREKLTFNEFYYLLKINTDVTETPNVKLQHRKYFDYGMSPSFRMFLNDPSGFFKYRLGGTIWGSFNPWKGGSFFLGLEGYAVNDVSTVNDPSAQAVRTDIVPYLQQPVQLGRLLYSHIYKTGYNIYGKFAAGLLERQYAGFDGELAMPIKNGRFYVGLSGSVVKKRDPDNVFELSSKYPETYHTAFLNTQLNIPEIEVSVNVKAGRFLAGDTGARVMVTKFINGFILGAWYSWTDTSIFTDSFNRGYNDKGIMIMFPFRLLRGTDSKTNFTYAISPWTRDVAQDISHHYNTLFDIFGRNSKIYLDKDKKMIYK